MSGHRSRILVIAFAVAATPPLSADAFVRGDVDESGSLGLTDGVRIVRYLFLGEAEGVRCEDAADADDSGSLDITDAIFLLNGLFRGGPAPPDPAGACGGDATPDDLGCAAFEPCSGLIVFHGHALEAGSIVFAVDTSLRVADDGQLTIMVREISTVIRALPPDTDFGIVCFNSAVDQYPENGIPARAKDATAEAALAFLAEREARTGSCPQSGLTKVLSMAEKSWGPKRAIVYWGSGSGDCAGADEGSYLRQTLATALAMNIHRIPFHTFGYRVPGLLQEGFLRDLAEETGGEYHAVGE